MILSITFTYTCPGILVGAPRSFSAQCRCKIVPAGEGSSLNFSLPSNSGLINLI